MHKTPVTERSYDGELDGSADVQVFLRTLFACDGMIFAGYQGMPNLWDLLGTVRQLAGAVGTWRLIMSGCGTSGRIAFLTARRFKFSSCDYLIAGGDSALLLSDELPEDSPEQGAADLAALVSNLSSSPAFLVGVTCGLSAPYVAGQLRAAAPHCAAVGFNPISLARREFADLCLPLPYVVNPIIGPEAVAGSSRMKGGSATLILLDLLCLAVCGHAESASALSRRLAEYQRAHSTTYHQCAASLPPLMAAAAQAISSGGRLFYVGAGAPAILGLIDLSEMPDTYGASFEQNRAFVVGGWTALGNREGDISHLSKLHRIDLEHFVQDIVLGPTDLVVLLMSDETSAEHVALLEKAVAPAQQLGLVYVSSTSSCSSLPASLATRAKWTVTVALECHEQGPLRCQGLIDLSVKIVCNAISTFAQARGRGAVFRGMMIAAGPSNNKIYQRCVDMIVRCTGVSAAVAEEALIKTIYNVDAVAPALAAAPRSQHIRQATLPVDQRHRAQLTLPVALIVALCGCSVAHARGLVEKEVNLGLLLQRLMMESDVNRDSQAILSIDLGGTNVRAALVVNGTLRCPVKRALSGRSPEAVLTTVCDTVKAVVGEVSAASIKISSISISQPGSVAADGSIGRLAAFDWPTNVWVPISLRVLQCVAEARPDLDKTVKVRVFEDAMAACAAEVMAGAGRCARTCVTLVIGTGVGSAVYLGDRGQFLRGQRGLIEMGHSVVQCGSDPAPLCSCGQQGCVEAYASGAALARRTALPSAEHVFASAGSDSKCGRVLNEAALAVALCCLNMVRAYDPDVVVLCGPVAVLLLPRIRAHWRRLVWRLHADASHVPLSLASCTEPGVTGAAVLASDSFPQRFWLRRANGQSDLPDLYRVCLKTGDAGNDGSHLFTDPELLGKIYVGPYVIFSPDFAYCLVSERDGVQVVCGYVLAVLDTAAFSVTCQEKWWPELRKQYSLNELASFRPNEVELIRYVIHGNAAPPPVDYQVYPSHLHIGILPEAQNLGLGTVMIKRVLDCLRGAGSVGLHVTMHQDNARAGKFYTKVDFEMAVHNTTAREKTFVLHL
jgi:N-acetylmuramic acid 6-phosphate (MurNAc-6-P) etherase/predicted NBD/HSP70 family sugar kinase/GNAT superfamily N-acetyltransferase